MALYEDRKINANTATYKDTNEPGAEYRLTYDQWRDVKKLDGDYNAQIALAAKYDTENRQRTESDEQAVQTYSNATTGEAHDDASGNRSGR